jgi:hypothetical protein
MLLNYDEYNKEKSRNKDPIRKRGEWVHTLKLTEVRPGDIIRTLSERKFSAYGIYS